MTITTINKNENFKREIPQTEGAPYREIAGDSARRFVKHLPEGHWQDLGRIKEYASPLAQINNEPWTIALGCYISEADGRPLLGSVSWGSTKLRLFVLRDEASKEQWLSDMDKFGGAPKWQREILKRNGEGDNARLLYACEAIIFSEAFHLSEVHIKSEFSLTEAQKAVEGTKAAVLNKGETLGLIRAIADEYSMKNIEVQFAKYDGVSATIATASSAQSFPLHALPTTLRVSIADTLVYEAVVLHEMAHLIEMWETGQSSHGKRFKELYVGLLNKYTIHSYDVADFEGRERE